MYKEDTQKKQVTVLGKTFTSEEERRTYFREELRKKLPELKKMEGFPIGEDDDIIKLSDPPFYTACPNPWLNDFILEWEEEKNGLEKGSKRSSDFFVDEPYAADVSEGKNSPIYTAHSYHTKVPHKAIMKYLIHYTQPGDIVYDGFAGSGMTGIAANRCGEKKEIESLGFHIDNNKILQGNEFVSHLGSRKSLLMDISPAASNLAYNNNNQVDVEKFERHAKKLISAAKEKFDWMFSTIDPLTNKIVNVEYYVWSEISTCNNCGGDLNFSEIAFSDDLKKMKSEIFCPSCGVEINKRSLHPQYKTKFDKALEVIVQEPKREVLIICFKRKGKKFYKKPDKFDNEVIDKILELPKSSMPTAEIPDMQMMRVGRMKQTKITHTHQFYTTRLNHILSFLWEESDKIKDKNEKEIIRYWLDSHFVNLSYRNRYRPNVSFPYNPMTGVFYVPMMSSEANPFVAYENKIKRITRAFQNSLLLKGETINYTGSAVESGIKGNSIDYIFTDPPFGENIYYSDLNYFIEAWNRVYTNPKSEAIIDKVKNKTLPDYNNLMQACFLEYYRILKPNKWMTVVFSNTQAAVWNGIRLALTNAGFIIANISALDKKQGSFMSVNTTTAVKQDLVISCYKPSSEFNLKFTKSHLEDKGIWDFIEEHIEHLPRYLSKNGKTISIMERSSKILFDSVIKFYFQRNFPIPIDAGKFQQGLRERFVERDGMFFTEEQVHEYERKKTENPEFVQLSILVSSEQDGVLWLKNLLQIKPQTYQDIHPQWMQALVGIRKGDIIPELSDVLQENFLEEKQGKWYVPDPEKEADLEKMRNKRLLRQFEEYKKQVSKPKGKIKEARVEALRAGFKQSYQDKDFKTIVQVGDRIPNQLLMEDEVLLLYYDIASSRV